MSILVVAMAKNEPTSSKNVTTNTTEQACMEGIVIWLVAAQSVIQSPVWALDSNFSKNMYGSKPIHYKRRAF